ncbi:MAG: ThuA domain-containing protein [Acidobacteria bacterium]|nr:ThuA domain-containing protein [Acidobacteriota bacterium]MBI3655225.1 ThuA domain-containing protein [Acidobacteriota bacterium]
MNRREMMIKTGAVALGARLCGFPASWVAKADAPKRRILFFTKSSSFEHSVIRRRGNQLSHAEQILTDLGKQHGFNVAVTKNGSLLTAAYLADFDALAFFTTGDLTQAGLDRQPPMTPEGKAALLAAIKNGKGFIGFHASTDTFKTPGDPYQDYGDQKDPYIAMIGGEFIKHGAQQKAKMIATDVKFPGCGGFNDGFEMMEEWYSLKHYANDLHVLLVQETRGMKGKEYERPPYPATWVRRHGKGRVFYTSMGHREDVWTNPIFQAILLGGISWAVGQIEADVTPNLAQVAPRYMEMPPKG